MVFETMSCVSSNLTRGTYSFVENTANDKEQNKQYCSHSNSVLEYKVVVNGLNNPNLGRLVKSGSHYFCKVEFSVQVRNCPQKPCCECYFLSGVSKSAQQAR